MPALRCVCRPALILSGGDCVLPRYPLVSLLFPNITLIHALSSASIILVSSLWIHLCFVNFSTRIYFLSSLIALHLSLIFPFFSLFRFSVFSCNIFRRLPISVIRPISQFFTFSLLTIFVYINFITSIFLHLCPLYFSHLFLIPPFSFPSAVFLPSTCFCCLLVRFFHPVFQLSLFISLQWKG